MAALTAATLALAGLLVYAIERDRLEEQTRAAVDQELQEFARIQAGGLDPTTSEPFQDVASMLELFFQRNIPDDDELLVGWIEGRRDPVRFLSPAEDPVVDDAAFRSAASDVARTGGSARFDVPGEGEVLLVGQPVRFRSDSEAGALLVVTRLDVGRAALRDTMRTYAIVSALALLLVAGAAFRASPRARLVARAPGRPGGDGPATGRRGRRIRITRSAIRMRL